ncbi:Rsp5p-dependent ubiquitination, sorting of cargo proteins at the multivesicular body [Allomyces javanicus]|nr:Rsp5p-dependent ubiquitination, sorting of cargo proteins at the multivesicular body [Allomyces javanicus]KAJ3362939.1 Rsp5p-dependent ubiquitination, sorting of cargo proteins at the multivesicular body [Allomyces javanicus]
MAGNVTSDTGSLPLPVIIAIPVIAALVVVLLAHCVILRINPTLRDGTGKGRNQQREQAKTAPNPDQFFKDFPHPVYQAFPPAPPQFDPVAAGKDVKVTVLNENTFELEFFKMEITSIQATLPVSKEYNCMQVEILQMGNPGMTVGIGFARNPYPTFRMPGWHQHSVAFHTNDRKFVDKGGYIGEKFTIAPNRNVSVAKNEQNVYYLTANIEGQELYLTQGTDPISFDRVLARPHEFRTRTAQYFPTIGVNAPAKIRVVFYHYDHTEIQAKAYAQEAKYHQPGAPGYSGATQGRIGVSVMK